MVFSTVGSRAEAVMKRSGFVDKIGEEWLHPSVHSAVQHCVRHRQIQNGEAQTGEEADEPKANGASNGVTVSVV